MTTHCTMQNDRCIMINQCPLGICDIVRRWVLAYAGDRALSHVYEEMRHQQALAANSPSSTGQP